MKTITELSGATVFPIGYERTENLEGTGRLIGVDLLETPHIVIGGGPGWGKTKLIQKLVAHANAHPEMWKTVNLINPVRSVDSTDMEVSPMTGTITVIDSIDTVLARLGEVLSELHARRDMVETSGLDVFLALDEPRYLVTLDDIESFLQNRHKLRKTAEEREVHDAIQEIIEFGAEVHIHLVLSSRDPKALIEFMELNSPNFERIAKVIYGPMSSADSFFLTKTHTAVYNDMSAIGNGVCVVGDAHTYFRDKA